MILKATGT